MTQQLPDRWPVEIISQTGKLLAHSSPAEIDSDKLAAEEILAAKRLKFSGLLDTTAKDGTPTKTILVPIGNSDWSVLMETPLDRLNAPAQHVVELLFIFGGAFAILGGLAVVLPAYLQNDNFSDGVELEQPLVTKNSRSLLGPSLVALLASILLGGYTAWLTQENLQRIADSVDSQQKNHAEQRQIEELEHLFNELEIGQRGFASTGNVVFLAFFSSASKQLPALIARIKTEFSKPDRQEFNWTDFDSMFDQYMQYSAKTMSPRKASGAPFGLEDAPYTDGKLVLDKLQLQVAEMGKRLDKRIERGAIHIASQRENASQQQWLSTFAISGLFSISVAIWLYERQRRMHIHRQLEMSHQLLEERVTQRTHDLATANQLVRSHAQEVQALIDSERKRMSREVHDQIGQIFTAIKMIMGSLHSDRLDTAQKAALSDAVNSGVTISRRIAAELRPPLLDDFGLSPAFEHFLKTICEPARLGYEFHFPVESQIANRHMTELFRIMQESCVNVVAHANAMHLEVVGTLSNDMLEVCIDDDGVGFDPAHVRTGALGILGMQERAKLIDAKIDFAVSPMGGTRVHIIAPLIHSEEGAKI
jgi:signal transduction histidine kinase